MRRLLIALMPIAAAALALAPFAHAQTWRGYSITLNRPFQHCSLAALNQQSSDDFITFGQHQIHASRLGLEGISIGGTYVVSGLIHRFVPGPWHRSAKLSAATAGVGLGVGPHLYSQGIARKYPIDVTHDLAEISQRMAPYAITTSDDGSFRGDLWALLRAGALITLGACDAQYGPSGQP